MALRVEATGAIVDTLARANPGLRAASHTALADAISLPRQTHPSLHQMARINIEASAALAEWIDLYRAYRGGRGYGSS